MKHNLSGAAVDVLAALFFRGALVDGDLPSKAGAAELRELDYMVTKEGVRSFDLESYYNFLTPAGQEFAISYLVDGGCGKPKSKIQELVLKVSLDTTEATKKIEALGEAMSKLVEHLSTASASIKAERFVIYPAGFHIEKDGQAFIKCAHIEDAKIESADVKDDSIGQRLDAALSLIDTSHLNKLGSPAGGEVTNTVTINIGVNDVGSGQFSEIINKHLQEALKPGGILRERR